MKAVACLVILTISTVLSAELDNTYLPPNSARTAGGNGDILRSPTREYGAPIISPENEKTVISSVDNHRKPVVEAAFRNPVNHPVREPSTVYGPAQQSNIQRSNNPEAHARILRFDNNNDGNGNYHFDFETENKIRHEEHGQLKQIADGEAVVVQGSYSYIGDDGKTYTVTYIADENGFQPSGEHIDETISKTASEAARSAIPDVTQEQHNYYNGAAVSNRKGQKLNGGYQY